MILSVQTSSNKCEKIVFRNKKIKCQTEGTSVLKNYAYKDL